MAGTRAERADEKLARMAAARQGSKVADPSPAADAAPVAPSSTPAARAEPEVRNVRLSVDLTQEMYDQLDDWMRAAARATGHGRFKRVLVMRALVRELLADSDLARRVQARVDDDQRRGA